MVDRSEILKHLEKRLCPNYFGGIEAAVSEFGRLEKAQRGEFIRSHFHLHPPGTDTAELLGRVIEADKGVNPSPASLDPRSCGGWLLIVAVACEIGPLECLLALIACMEAGCCD